MRAIDAALGMESGYVLNFSDRTFAEFFEDELGIEIYQDRYGFNGTSKTKHLRASIEVEDAYAVAKALRLLWRHRQTIPAQRDVGSEMVETTFLDLLRRFEGEAAVPSADALERFCRDETLEELVSAIEREIAANKLAVALGRLHTYCMKKFAHVLKERSITCDKTEALHSRVGKYLKALQQERELREMSLRIIKSTISVFEQFNEVRNNRRWRMTTNC